MTQPAKTQDPTMEDILASIRRIIADDDERPAAGDATRRRAEAVPPPAPRSQGTGGIPPGQLKVVRPDQAEPASADPQPGPCRADGESAAPPMMSPATAHAVESAFGSLAETGPSRAARTLEEIAGDLLRPMLKAWLDDNLPGLVERLVSAEIARVARGNPR